MKYKYLLFVCLLFTLTNAQVPYFGWVSQIGGSGLELGASNATDAFGNIYTIGGFGQTIDIDPGTSIYNLTSNGSRDIFIQKLNPAGDFIWAKSLGGSNSDYARSISINSSGDIIIAGIFSSYDFDPGGGLPLLTNTNGGETDVFVVKMDTSGNFIWAKSFGGFDREECVSVVTDSIGDVYVTGSFKLIVDFDPDSANTFNITSNGESDIYILKLSTDGNFIWVRSFGDNFTDSSISITIDSSQNVYTVGAFQGLVDFDPGIDTFNLTSGGADAFILKLDPTGNFLWANRTGTFSPEAATSVITDIDENVYVIGTFFNEVDFDPGPGIFNLTAGYSDIYIQKLSSAGNFIWAKQIGGLSSSNGGTSIIIDPENSIYCIGTFSGTTDFDPGSSTNNITASGQRDIFVLKLDTSGNYIWSANFGGSDDDFGYSISSDLLGNIYCTGSFKENVNFNPYGGTGLLLGSNIDGFILKLEPTCIAASSSINQNVCYSYTNPSGTDTYTSSGTYYDTLLSVSGCDSILTINLTVNDSSSSSINEVVCDSYLVPSGTTTLTSSGIYYDTLQNSLGCDSTIKINLTVNKQSTSIFNDTVCDTYISPSGKIYNSSGTYLDTIQNTLGCDSMLEINLFIPTFNITINSISTTLTVSADDALFQWVDCDNDYFKILDETNFSYTASTNGNYAVIVNQIGCIDTSTCYTLEIEPSNITSSPFLQKVQVYPNPAQNEFRININDINDEFNFTVYNELGKEFFKSTLNNSITINSIHWPAGVYHIFIKDINGMPLELEKIIIER